MDGKLRRLPPQVRLLDTRIAAPLPKRVAPFYVSAAWRALIGRLIQERGRRCERCGRTGCRLYGDHVVELKDGGAELDPANIELLCGSCHGTKTAAVRAARMRS